MSKVVKTYRAPLSQTSIRNLQSIVGAPIVAICAPSGTCDRDGGAEDLPSVSLHGGGRPDWLNISAELLESELDKDYALLSVEAASAPLWIDYDERRKEIRGNHISLRIGTDSPLAGITVHEWRGEVRVVDGPHIPAGDELISFDRFLEFTHADGSALCIGTSRYIRDQFAFEFGAFGARAAQGELGAYRARLRIEKHELINDSEHRRSD